MDLTRFIETKQKYEMRQRRCMTCALPASILAQVHAAREKDKPIPFTWISTWLEREHKVKIQHATLRNHFVAGHHNDQP